MLSQYVPSVHRPLPRSCIMTGPTLTGERAFTRTHAARATNRNQQFQRLMEKCPLPKKVSSRSLRKEIQKRTDWEKLVRSSLRDMELGNKNQCFRDQNPLILSFLPKTGSRIAGFGIKRIVKKPKTNTQSKNKKLKNKKVVKGKARTVYSNSKGNFVNIDGKRKYIKLNK